MKETERKYGTEVRAKYGDTQVDGMYARIMGASCERYQEWERLDMEIREKLSAAVLSKADPAGELGKEITALHHRWLIIMGDQYDVQRHRGLAELYVQDKRFTAYYDKEQPGCAQFLRDAVFHWAK